MNSPIELVPHHAAELVSEIVRGGPDIIDELADEWRRLMPGGPCDEPFYTPEWIHAYVSAFANGSEVVIVTARAAGQLVALLPLVRETRTVAGIRLRVLRSAGNAHTCRYELVHAATHRGAAIDAIWRALERDAGWDTLELESVPVAGAAAE